MPEAEDLFQSDENACKLLAELDSGSEATALVLSMISLFLEIETEEACASHRTYLQGMVMMGSQMGAIGDDETSMGYAVGLHGPKNDASRLRELVKIACDLRIASLLPSRGHAVST